MIYPAITLYYPTSVTQSDVRQKGISRLCVGCDAEATRHTAGCREAKVTVTCTKMENPPTFKNRLYVRTLNVSYTFGPGGYG